MAAYTIINGTDDALDDVDGSGTDVAANTFVDGVTLNNTQLAALAVQIGVAVTGDLTGVDDAPQRKRAVSTASRYPQPA